MPTPPTLSFEQGLAVVRGEPLPALPTVVQWDARFGGYVAAGHHYPVLREWAVTHAIPEQSVPGAWAHASFTDARIPRDAQREAVQRWQAAGCRGTVVLPTGAGKTFVALLAIALRRCATCVVVPTRALVNQ